MRNLRNSITSRLSIRLFKQPDQAILFLILATSILISIAGITSTISVGDEVYQFRFAKLWFETGERPVYDPLIETSNRGLYIFDSDPFWADGLLILWKILGGISKPALQIYQAGYYGILVLATYLLGKQLYNKQVGFNGAIIVATTPFFVAYSVLTYIDVPAVALTMVAFLFLAKKQYFWAGLMAGLAFLTKRNTWLLIPPLGIYLLFVLKGSRIKNLFLFALPAGLITIYELAARAIVWGGIFFPPKSSTEAAMAILSGEKIARFPGMFEIGKSIFNGTLPTLFNTYSIVSTIPLIPFSPQATSNTPPASPVPLGWGFTPSNIIYDPTSVFTYLGIVLVVLLMGYIFLRRQKAQDIFLILPISLYLLEYIILFNGMWAVRYIGPIMGLLAILAAVVFGEIISKIKLEQNKKLLVVLLFVICIIQFSTSLGKVFFSRQISRGLQDAYAYIEKQLPVNTRFFYPEYSLSEQTGRPMIWIRVGDQLPYLFWDANEEDMLNIFNYYEISYVMVKKDRIYDDTNVKHRLGYPMTFIKKLDSFSSINKVFENEEVEILKIPLPK